jgi:DNA-binding transcriptional ArsR family regulator
MTVLELKTDNDTLEEAAQMLKAIAHPMRLSIVTLLNTGRMTVTEIFEGLGVEQAVASHHLNIMKDRGVLTSERDGKHMFYALKHPNMMQIVHVIYDCCEN